MITHHVVFLRGLREASATQVHGGPIRPDVSRAAVSENKLTTHSSRETVLSLPPAGLPCPLRPSSSSRWFPVLVPPLGVPVFPLFPRPRLLPPDLTQLTAIMLHPQNGPPIMSTTLRLNGRSFQPTARN